MAEPSKVIHIRNVGHEISESELLQVVQPFGTVAKLVMLRAKNQALVQMEDLASAVNVIQYYNTIQPSLGSMKKVAEDLSYVVALRRKFGYLESIPGVLLPHPSSSAAAFPAGGCVVGPPDAAGWPGMMASPPVPPELYVDPYGAAAAAGAGPPPSMQIMPSMSSLEALLSKLPSVVPAAPSPTPGSSSMPPTGAAAASSAPPKEEAEDDYVHCHGMDMATSSTNGGGESTSGGGAPLPSSYFVNVGVKPSEGF